MTASSTASCGTPLIFRRGMTLPLSPACSSFILPSGAKSRLSIFRSLMLRGIHLLLLFWRRLFCEILDRLLAADALVHAAATRDGNTDHDFVRSRAVRYGDRHRVIVRTNVEFVLVREGNID